MEEVIKQFETKIEDFKGSVVSKEVFDALKNELNDLKEKGATAEAVKALNDAIIELKEAQKTNNNQARVTLDQELRENKDDIISIAKGVSSKELVIKAISNRASVANNEQAVDLTDVGQLATRKLSIYDVFPKVTVSGSNHNGTIRYYDWDEDTIARAAASVAEGAAFPESTAKFKKGSVVIEKIGDTLPVTEEFFEDEEMFASELNLFLDTNVSLQVDSQLCNGTGAANTLFGVFTLSPAYTPIASGITDANIFDLIVKMAEDITVTGGSKYNPDTIIARRSVINQMKLKKDGNNNYMLPPFVSSDGKNIDGMVVVESNIAPANSILICDKRFGRIYEKAGLELSKGFVGNQYVEDAMTLKARKRLAFLIRNADKGGFRKVTDIAAALVTLAT
jgi:HK97 family phage major capsid protein